MLLLCVLPLRLVAAQAFDQRLASIRRVTPGELRILPAPVRAVLDARGCRVPQAQAPTTTNAVRGAFTAAHRLEWAVLCSVHDTSRILVLSLNGVVLDSLERSADIGWVQQSTGGSWAYSRRLSVVPPSAVRRWHRTDGDRIPLPIDHDAIGDAFEGKGASGYYFASGRWYRRITAD